MSDKRFGGLTGYDGIWNPLTATTEPLSGPGRGERVVVHRLTSSGRRFADRGEVVHRDTFVVRIASEIDGRERVYRLIDYLCRAE